MDRAEPQGAHAHLIEIVQLGGYSVEIPYPVAVAVGEGIYQELISSPCPLLAIEGCRLGHQVGHLVPTLGHLYRSILGSFDGNAALTVISVIRGNGD